MSQAGALSASLLKAQAWLEDKLSQTQHLRPLLAGACLLLVTSLIVTMFSWSRSNIQSLRNAQTELARLEMQIKEGSWPERKKQVETILFGLRERLWTAETAGLAEAGLERWLREHFEKVGLRPDSIRIQRTSLAAASDSKGKSPFLSGLQRMTAKVIVSFEPTAALQVLSDAAAFEKIIIVDRLLIRGGRNALIEMDISTILALPKQANSTYGPVS